MAPPGHSTTVATPYDLSVKRSHVLAVVVILMVASCRTAAPTASSTVATAVTVTSTTVPPAATTVTTAVTATTSAASSTSVRSADGCNEVAASGGSASGAYKEAVFDGFGPLEPAPSLTIEFDHGRNGDPIGLRAVRIEGGVLVSASRSVTVASTAGGRLQVAAVNHDGTIRWSDCLEGSNGVQMAVAMPEHQPENALLSVLIANVPDRRYRFVQLSLSTGAEQSKFVAAMQSVGVAGGDLDRLGFAAVTDRYALLVDNVAVVGGTYEHVVRYDLVTDVAVDVGVPNELLQARMPGPCSGGLQPALSKSGDVIVSDLTTDVISGAVETTGTATVVARWHDGTWSHEPSLLAGAVGVRPGFACEDDLAARVLRGVDALGRVRWTDRALTHPGADDVGWYLDGDIVLGQVCSSRIGDACDRFELVGLDTATGQVRWTQPGLRLVAADPADGYALVWAEVVGDVLEPTGWVMLDDRTGREVSGQRWEDAGAFTLHPSRQVAGFDRTTRAGGLVLVITGAQLQVWYPKGTGGAPRSVVLH